MEFHKRKKDFRASKAGEMSCILDKEKRRPTGISSNSTRPRWGESPIPAHRGGEKRAVSRSAERKSYTDAIILARGEEQGGHARGPKKREVFHHDNTNDAFMDGGGGRVFEGERQTPLPRARRVGLTLSLEKGKRREVEDYFLGCRPSARKEKKKQKLRMSTKRLHSKRESRATSGILKGKDKRWLTG